MVPFGVKVLAVTTGAVMSQGQTYFEDWKLPEGSLYKEIEDTIASRARGNDPVKRMATSDYANKVVGDILGGATGRVWRGSMATTMKYVLAMVPTSVLVSGFLFSI